MRAWASVLTETNSIPSTPASIIRLTALPPAPPMPTTLMCANVSRITSSQEESRARAGAATGLAGTGVGVESAGGSDTGAAISRGAAAASKAARGRSLRWPSGCGGRRWPRTDPWLWDCMLLPHPGTRTPLPQSATSAPPAGALEGCANRHRGEGDARGAQDLTNVPGNDVHQIGAHPNPAVRLAPRSNAPPEYIALGLRQLLDSLLQLRLTQVVRRRSSDRSSASPIRRSTSSSSGMPLPCQRRGYMLIAVNPGIVFTSLM